MELLADTVGDGPTAAANANNREARQSRYVEVLREEVTRLNRSVQAILDHRAALNSVAQPFDLADVITESADLLRPQASRQNVVLQIARPEATAMVFGYRDRLKQALLNVAISGLTSMQDGGRLTIDLFLNTDAITATLRHTGPAIPEAVLKQIYQLHFTNGDQIGLYVARLVIESHGGEMAVENPVNGACRSRSLSLTPERCHPSSNTRIVRWGHYSSLLKLPRSAKFALISAVGQRQQSSAERKNALMQRLTLRCWSNV
jgi:signal transduction histidine kinase